MAPKSSEPLDTELSNLPQRRLLDHIADVLQERFEVYGADGFIILPALLPSRLTNFITLVAPELRRRGLVASSSANPQTLRQRFGLQRPAYVHGWEVAVSRPTSYQSVNGEKPAAVDGWLGLDDEFGYPPRRHRSGRPALGRGSALVRRGLCKAALSH